MADARDYLAEERTFLAWTRTGLAVMAFGFVVARFGVLVKEIGIAPDDSTHSHRPSLWLGTTLIAAGVAVNLLSAWRHRRLVAALNRGQSADRGPSTLAIALAVFLALFGIVLAIYLTVA